jgi:hypothetical protein
MDESCFDPVTHRPRLLSRQCGTCILLPGNLMRLRPGRLKDLVSDALQQGCQGIICHDTVSFGPHPDFGPALCRGCYDQLRLRAREGTHTSASPRSPPPSSGRSHATTGRQLPDTRGPSAGPQDPDTRSN